MTALSCSAASTRSRVLLGSSATPPSSSPTSSGNNQVRRTITRCSLVPAATVVSRACSPLRALDRIAEGGSTEVVGFVEDVLQTLNDLIEYFKQPDSELEHEEKQCLLRSLIKRQDLFKEEVRVAFFGVCSPTSEWM